MKVLVTGGYGFIGSHTVEQLIKRGHEVVIIDDLSTGKLSNLTHVEDKIEFIDQDICSLDIDYLREVVSEVDVVIHLAALVSVQESINNPTESFKRNCESFHKLLISLKGLGVPIVYASSAAVYGDSEHGILSPMSPYAADKITNEMYAESFGLSYNVSSIGMRYFNVYGTRQDPKSPYAGVIAKFVDCLKNDQDICIYGSGSQTRSFINVRDIAKFNVDAAEFLDGYVKNKNNPHKRWISKIDVGYPETISIIDLAKIIKSKNPTIQITFAEPKIGEVLHSKPFMNAFMKKDKESLVSLEKGIEELIAS
jgi:UDP-glucose 4-epimerase